jgi:hypothetical protein
VVEQATDAAYAPPKVEPEPPPVASGPEVRAARVAGAFIALAAVVNFVPWAVSALLHGLPLYGAAAAGALFTIVMPRVLGLAVDLVLAVPLLRGRRRWRWIAIGWSWLGILSSLVARVLAFSGTDPASVARWNHRFAEDCLYVAALVVLLTGRASRSRLGAALALIACFFASWTLRRTGLFGW